MSNRAVLPTAQVKNAGKKQDAGTYISASRWSPSSGTRRFENAGQTNHAGQEYPGHSFSRIALTEDLIPSSAGAGPARQFYGGGSSSTEAATATTEAPTADIDQPAEGTESTGEVSAADTALASESTESAEATAEAEAPPMLSWEYEKRFRYDALWWFNGERPRGFSTTANLVASGYSDPLDLNWRIVRGADKVAFEDAPTGPEVTLRSTAGSRRANDIEIEVSEGTGADAPTYTGTFTVRAPYRLIQRSVNDSATLPSWASAPAGAPGWWTTIGYRVVDNVGGTIVGATVNENFPGSKTNDQPNNWVSPASFSTIPVWPNTNGTFIDNWFVWGGTPTPVAPTAANANQSVDKMPHEFYVGSTVSGRGVRVQTHTSHRYLGYARHESITTPAP